MLVLAGDWFGTVSVRRRVRAILCPIGSIFIVQSTVLLLLLGSCGGRGYFTL
jgi:hypothetical protein